MGKTRYVTHEEALRESLKDPKFRFWYYVMKPKFWAIRFWMWIGRALDIVDAMNENRKEAYVEGFIEGSDWLRWREHGWTSFPSERHEAEAAAVMKWEARPRSAAYMASIGRPRTGEERRMPDPKKMIADFVKKDAAEHQGFWYCEYCDGYLGEAEQPDHSKHEEWCLVGALAFVLAAQSQEIVTPQAHAMEPMIGVDMAIPGGDETRIALALVLDQVDYESGACKVNEMVGAVLPKEILARARHAIGAKGK